MEAKVVEDPSGCARTAEDEKELAESGSVDLYVGGLSRRAAVDISARPIRQHIYEAYLEG